MVKNDISRIPQKYIIDRWKKKEQKMFCNKPINSPADSDFLRINTLSRLSAEINSEGAKTGRKYNYLIKEFERLKEELQLIDLEEQQQNQSEHASGLGESTAINNKDGTAQLTVVLQDPDEVTTDIKQKISSHC
uniref:Uncharacterized protein n=1 Tax=Arundo donax TaxID=35708 RepID=A0A0A9DG11_ARUDO